MINGHGKKNQGLQHLLKADFSINVFDNQQTDSLLGYLQTQIPTIRNYPVPEYRILREKLATKFNISPYCVLVTNGFTEAFYLLAHPVIIKQLQVCHMPWAMNILALNTFEYIRNLPEKPKARFRQRLEESKSMKAELAQVPGLHVFPSPTNYFLSDLQQRTAAELKTQLLEQRGFLIRDATNFRGLGPGHFRVAAQNETLSNEFIHAQKAGINAIQPCLSYPSH